METHNPRDRETAEVICTVITWLHILFLFNRLCVSTQITDDTDEDSEDD